MCVKLLVVSLIMAVNDTVWLWCAAQVRAGLEARVKAAMTHGSMVQAELDGIKAVHEAELGMLRRQVTELQEHSAEQQRKLECATCQIGSCQEAAARCDISSA